MLRYTHTHLSGVSNRQTHKVLPRIIIVDFALWSGQVPMVMNRGMKVGIGKRGKIPFRLAHSYFGVKRTSAGRSLILHISVNLSFLALFVYAKYPMLQIQQFIFKETFYIYQN